LRAHALEFRTKLAQAFSGADLPRALFHTAIGALMAA
jgi:hypothetical protein